MNNSMKRLKSVISNTAKTSHPNWSPKKESRTIDGCIEYYKCSHLADPMSCTERQRWVPDSFRILYTPQNSNFLQLSEYYLFINDNDYSILIWSMDRLRSTINLYLFNGYKEYQNALDFFQKQFERELVH